MRNLAVLGSTILMTSASTCTAHEPTDQSNIGFLCAVDSTKMIKPNMDIEAVCALFKTKIDDVLKRKTVAIEDGPNALPADWIKVEVRFSMPATTSATVVQSADGKETTHPQIAVDVMDKALEPSDIGTLASAVAKYLGENATR